MENILEILRKIHFAEIVSIYYVVIKSLTVVQDAIDAQPKDLKPPFGKAIYYLTAIGGSLGFGNRPASITPPTNKGV